MSLLLNAAEAMLQSYLLVWQKGNFIDMGGSKNENQILPCKDRCQYNIGRTKRSGIAYSII
jgi:hypothetical protein